MDLNKELNDTLNKEIIRELLKEEIPNISDENIDFIWSSCSGNPWNSIVMYKIFEITNQLK